MGAWFPGLKPSGRVFREGGGAAGEGSGRQGWLTSEHRLHRSPPPNRVIRPPRLRQALGVVQIPPIKDQLLAQGSGQLIEVGRHVAAGSAESGCPEGLSISVTTVASPNQRRSLRSSPVLSCRASVLLRVFRPSACGGHALAPPHPHPHPQPRRARSRRIRHGPGIKQPSRLTHLRRQGRPIELPELLPLSEQQHRIRTPSPSEPTRASTPRSAAICPALTMGSKIANWAPSSSRSRQMRMAGLLLRRSLRLRGVSLVSAL